MTLEHTARGLRLAKSRLCPKPGAGTRRAAALALALQQLRNPLVAPLEAVVKLLPGELRAAPQHVRLVAQRAVEGIEGRVPALVRLFSDFRRAAGGSPGQPRAFLPAGGGA